MINYQKAAFEFAAGRVDQLPPTSVPEIVFSGRSNVGKSSLINKVINRKSLARVSGTPGKTGTINFYDLRECKLVDLPGYGYAKVSESEKMRWAGLVEGYLSAGRKISLVVQIVDMRRPPTDDDLHMVNFLIGVGLPFLVVATKCDKLNKTEYRQSLEELHSLFSQVEGLEVLPFSAVSGEGVAEMRAHIEACCAKE